MAVVARVVLSFATMDGSEVSRWFDGYLAAFAACGRGESETDALLAYYGVPLLITTADGVFALASGAEVVAVVQRQIDGMRAAGYARSEILASEVKVVNAKSALYEGTFSYRRSDGGEISRLAVTYLITVGAAGRRISVLAVHAP